MGSENGIACIRQLGEAVEARWQAVDHDPRQISDIAVAAMAEARLPERLSPDEVVRWALSGVTVPQQRDLPAKFGQPPVTLFRSRRFYIEALFWIDGTTTIHEHAFSGAFQVLAGSSIETRYRFEAERRFDGHFVLGALSVASSAYLRAGDVRPIHSGRGGLIHALFHLERPSVTIVVRTYRDADAGPQLNYHRPGIGYDPFLVDETRDRAAQVIAMLRNTEHPQLEAIVGDAIARADLPTAYKFLGECATIPDRALVDRLLGRVRDPAAAEQFRAAHQEGRRIAFLQSRRALVKPPELRFFLGVLLNAHQRAAVLQLVRARVPDGDPARQVARWVRELSNINMKLQVAGAPWQPNLLGIPEMTDDLEQALAATLTGAAPPPNAADFIRHLQDLPALRSLFA